MVLNSKLARITGRCLGIVCALFASLAIHPSAAAQPLPRLTLTDNQELALALTSISADGVLAVQSGRPKRFALDDVARIEFSHAPSNRPAAIHIDLVDGSHILASQVTVENRIARIIESDTFENKVATRNIRTIDFIGQRFSPLREQWDEILRDTNASGDMLIVQRNEQLDYIEGIVGDISDKEIQFRMDNREVAVNRERIEGVAYYHATGREIPEPVCVGVTCNGSRLMIKSVDVTNNDIYQFETLCGAKLTLAEAELLYLDFTTGRFAQLSQLTPSAMDWRPLIQIPKIYPLQRQLNQPRFDQSFDGEPLSLEFPVTGDMGPDFEVRQYQYGIAAKGGTKLVYNLDRRYQWLRGVVGFAPKASFDGIVEVVIEADGQTLWRQVINRRQRQPAQIELPVADVSRLSLVVDYNDGRDVGDWIHFCDFRVSR